MPDSARNQWLELAPKPWPLKPGEKWHTYISYRSIYRPWVLQLYDILKQLGYSVFLDQYVLTPGQPILEALDEGVEQSASAVLVWASRASESTWIQREHGVIAKRQRERKEFRLVVVTLDKSPVPAFAADNIIVDFSDFQQGPTGTPLLQLVYGLHGQPLAAHAVEVAAEVDTETKRFLAAIRSARSVGQPARLLRLAREQSLAWQTSPFLLCEVIESLIALREYEHALEIAQQCRQEFPNAIRPQQLEAKTRARMGDWQTAQLILAQLYESGERDAETLAMLGSTWMDRYRSQKNPLFLQRSRDLYLEAFRTSPDDTYAGVNAASKSAMLGELEEAAKFAQEVERVVGSASSPGDFWQTVTSAELRLLQRDYQAAARLYGVGVAQDPLALGTHESVYRQAASLLDALEATPEQRSLVLSPFEHLSHPQTADSDPPFDPQPADRQAAAKLLFSLVARRYADPGLIDSLDPAKFWEAVRKVRPEATRRDLPAVATELNGHATAVPSPVWLAWIETVRSRDLDRLLQ